MKRKKSFFIKILLSNFFLIFVLFIIAILGWRMYGEYENNKLIDNEIDGLKQEIKDLENSSEEFSKLIEYFDSDIFIEKEAREKFGLKKEGEQVVVVPKEAGIDNKSQDYLINNKETKKFFPKLWWEYFFVNNPK
ncbi:septum formation initiator family protein [Candidatus Parcubacteria bacterium]|nr:septum formation initiator family protein [Candidatus Parcubacteria bacterium]